MKLLMTPTSPYSRRARIAIIEAGYGDKCEEIDCGPLADHVDKVLAHSPGGKVPTLVLDDGTTLSECMIIAHYMDGLCGGKLYPTDPAAATACYRLESLGALMMDSTFVRSGQNRLDASEQSQTIIEKEKKRSARIYDALEAAVGDLEGQTHMGALSVVAALSYADWRAAADNWRASHPKLDAWMKSMESHPSIAATARPGD
jgi:glutathione S-transferase